ncbi:MAG: hypothetical protein HPY69_16275 [Armatimonadetes bacterium]|nr:hypothetical protein [Armatimonadota bacterium]
MRVSTVGHIESIKASLARQSARLGKLHQQLSAGKRVCELSDDPVAASRVARAHTALSELGSRRFVIREAQQLLGAADAALADMGQALQRCHDLSLRAMSPQLGQGERLALAQEVRYLSTTLMAAGNASVQGTYIFAGTQTNTQPFRTSDISGLPVAYLGNHQAPVYHLSSTQSLPAGFTGAELFNYPDAAGQRPLGTVDTDVFSLLADLADSIERGDGGRVSELSGQVNACHEHVVGLRGQAGVMVQRCEWFTSACDATETRLRELLAQEEDLDIAAAITDLSAEQTAYQALLGMTARMLATPNLFEATW